MLLSRSVFVAAVAAASLILSTGRGAIGADPPQWLSGSAMREQLARPIKLAWSGMPIRKGLADLARSQSLAILLDRRVDPGTLLELGIDGAAVELALERIARSQQLGLSWYGPLVYFGPEAAAERLKTLAALRAADAKSLPSSARAPFTRQQPWRWDDLTMPRELVEQLAAEAKVEIEGLDNIPHDLWAAADLPPLSWTDRLTLVANEFDLTFRFDAEGRTLALTELPEKIVMERSYAAGRNPRELADRWARQAPEAEIAVVDGKVVVRGRAEDHERLTASKPRGTAPAGGGAEVYTLAVRDQPLGPVLEELRQRLGLELHIDEAALKRAGISLDRRVSFSVEQATLDDLFAAALKPAGLTFRRREKSFDIFPAEPPADEESSGQ
ncbi:MAG TPA: STN domain-containing protein [Pirellulales bacterium]|nr:STN domain-containing protein [Pirellulales bacterium]